MHLQYTMCNKTNTMCKKKKYMLCMPFICQFPLTVFEVSLTDIRIPLTEIEF